MQCHSSSRSIITWHWLHTSLCDLWPFDPVLSAWLMAAIDYICIKFGVDSSREFPFTARTHRHRRNTNHTHYPIPQLLPVLDDKKIMISKKTSKSATLQDVRFPNSTKSDFTATCTSNRDEIFPMSRCFTAETDQRDWCQKQLTSIDWSHFKTVSDFLICLTAGALKSPSLTAVSPLTNHSLKAFITVVLWCDVCGFIHHRIMTTIWQTMPHYRNAKVS